MIPRLIIFPVLYSLLLLASPVKAANEAEAFVQQNVMKVLGILSDTTLDETQKAAQFRHEILQIADVDVIARIEVLWMISYDGWWTIEYGQWERHRATGNVLYNKTSHGGILEKYHYTNQ